jgi:hypothetical protein
LTRHIVLLSTTGVLGPDAATDPVAKPHVEVEAALAASPITSTVLRPGAFAGNAESWSWSIRASGAVSLPYPGAHSDPLHELDIAEVAVAVLTRPELAGSTYTLSGLESLAFEDQIACIARATGKPVTIDAVTRDEWRKEMAEHVPDDFAEALLDWWQASDGVPIATNGTVEAPGAELRRVGRGSRGRLRGLTLSGFAVVAAPAGRSAPEPHRFGSTSSASCSSTGTAARSAACLSGDSRSIPRTSSAVRSWRTRAISRSPARVSVTMNDRPASGSGSRSTQPAETSPARVRVIEGAATRSRWARSPTRIGPWRSIITRAESWAKLTLS